MQCKFIRKNKQQCKAHSMRGTKLCFRHSPNRVKQALEASQAGGTNRSPAVAFQEDITFKTTRDIQKLIGKVINGVWQGKVPIKVGSTIGFLTRCWLDAYEKSELEIRVEELEKKITAL